MIQSIPSKAVRYSENGAKMGKTPVYIYLDSPESISNLPSNIEILTKDGKIAAAKLTLNEMNELSQLESVERIGIPHMAEFYGHAVSQGVSFSMADNFHSVGIDGSGVTVGIIDGGFFPNNPEISSNVVSSMLFDAFNFCNGDIACGDPLGDSHGTAVAEIVVDEAPGASLLLATIATNIDYINAVDYLKDNGADIIIASLGFPTLGSDGVGPNAQYFRAGTSDVAIIGGGILGTTISYWLSNILDPKNNYFLIEISVTSIKMSRCNPGVK